MKLYNELASWWPVMSAPEDYAEEAELFRRTLLDACPERPRTLLELGSGGGNNASHLKAHFEMTLVELSEGMLSVSRELNPECEHHQGDMRTARLDREFDAVFIHDAIDYMTSESDLRAAMETAYVHCKLGGAALLVPDHIRENFHTSTDCGGEDAEDRSFRYLEWTWDPDPNDTTYVADYAFLMSANGEPPKVVHDRHIGGLFARDVWLSLLRDVGFEPAVVPFVHSEVEPGEVEMFVGRKTESLSR